MTTSSWSRGRIRTRRTAHQRRDSRLLFRRKSIGRSANRRTAICARSVLYDGRSTAELPPLAWLGGRRERRICDPVGWRDTGSRDHNFDSTDHRGDLWPIRSAPWRDIGRHQIHADYSLSITAEFLKGVERSRPLFHVHTTKKGRKTPALL